MRLEFHGAAGTVTGSHIVLDTGPARIGIDAGAFQGGPRPEELNRRGFGHDLRTLRALLLTHAHIDHSGRVPALFRQGFGGPLFATAASSDLCELMLRDSARLMEEQALNEGRHPEQRDLPRAPLFDDRDVTRALEHFRPVGYGAPAEIAGTRVVFRDAGHILGSAMLEVDAGGQKLVFCGDLGRRGAPLLRDPELIGEADWLVLESTYGDRDHGERENRGEHLFQIVRETVDGGGNVIIPAFAVGRTQELLYELNPYAERGSLRGIRCFVDSPMAISATGIYRRHPECFDAETGALLARGDDPLEFPGMRLTRTREESKGINELREPHIVVSANGMCTGGRILFHLARNLGRRESTILLVGYQAAGTTGRQLQEGARSVRLLGREVEVRARIEVLSSFSAHADRSGILEWLKGFRRFPEKVFLNHGEPAAAAALAEAIRQRFGAKVLVPGMGDRYELG